MTFQVDLSTAKARREVTALNEYIDLTTSKLSNAAGAAARLSQQAKSMGGTQINQLTTSVNNLNATILRTSQNWAKTKTAGASATQSQLKEMQKLNRESDKLSKKSSSNKRSTDNLGHSFHSTSQKAAAFRASMYALNTHMGMFTARTLIAATTAYAFIRAIRSTISVGAEYEKSMQRVYAISGALGEVTGQITPEMKMLDDAVRKVGKTTVFTAAQVAEGAVQFAMAGFDAQETAEALNATASLASIGMTDMATAAGLAANILNSFGMESSQLTEVVDRMAVAVTGSMMDMRQLGTALSYVGPLANDTNTSFRDTVIILELMHDAGIKASKAGTALRRGMVNLLNPSKKQKAVLTELNIATKDTNGEMRSMLAISKDLASKGIKPAAVATLFGARAVAAWSQVIGQAKNQIEGTKSKLTEFEAAQDAAKGKAEKLRKELEENLISQFTLFKSAIQDVQQDIFNHLVPALTDSVKWLTEFTKSINPNNIVLFVKILGGAIAAFIALKTVMAVAALKATILAANVTFVSLGLGKATTAAWGFNLALNALSKHPILIALAGITAAWYLLKDSAEDAGDATIKVSGQMSSDGAKMVRQANSNALKLKNIKAHGRLEDLRDEKQHQISILETAFRGDKERLKSYQHLYAEVKALDDKLKVSKRKVDQYAPQVDPEAAKAKGLAYAKAFTEGLKTAKPVDLFKRLAKSLTKKKVEDPFEVSAESSKEILRMDQEFYTKRSTLDSAYAEIKASKLKEIAEYELGLAKNVSDGGDAEWKARISAANKSLQVIEDTYAASDTRLLEQRELALQKRQALEDKYAKKKRADEIKASRFDKQLFEAETEAKLSNTHALLGTMSTLMESNRKKEFELGKRAALANIVVSTGEGVMKAWGMGGLYGGAMAAAIATAGALQYRTVQAQHFGGGGGVSSSVDTGSSTSALVAPAVASPEATTGSVTINIDGNVYGDALDTIIAEITDAVDNNDVILFSPDSRQAQEITA